MQSDIKKEVVQLPQSERSCSFPTDEIFMKIFVIIVHEHHRLEVELELRFQVFFLITVQTYYGFEKYGNWNISTVIFLRHCKI